MPLKINKSKVFFQKKFVVIIDIVDEVQQLNIPEDLRGFQVCTLLVKR